MKRIFSAATIIILLALSVSPSHAKSFNDNFNSGRIKRWEIIGSHKVPLDYGNWRVENKELLQTGGGDGYMALVESPYLSDQVVETDIKFIGPAGYGGFVIWYQDHSNLVYAFVYPGSGHIRISEWENGVETGTNYPYSISYNLGLWYNLKVDVDSTNGEIGVYVDEVKVITHTLVKTNRSGRTGLMNGNSGTYFDNFKLKAKVH